MNQEPLVSIIVNNYNYGRFLREAIDSALNQTYQKIEVIVVDDGSTDNSRRLITNYGEQIIPVLKENGGQASAFNAGFAHNHGAIVIFLDADDILLRDTVQRVVNIFQSNPSIARVQYRLELIDEQGRRTNTIVPPLYLPLPNGDLRWKILELVNCSSWSPTSGNAFAASTLCRILPMPESPFRLCADYYLSRVNALCGPIIPLDEVGAFYRSHGSNRYLASAINLAQIRQQILFTESAHENIRDFARSLDLDGYPDDATQVPDEMFLAQRMISLKLESQLHPLQKDTLLSLFWQGVKASYERTNLAFSVKLLHILWFAAMLSIPRPLALSLAEKYFPETRHSFNKLLNILQRREQQVSSNSRIGKVPTQSITAER